VFIQNAPKNVKKFVHLVLNCVNGNVITKENADKFVERLVQDFLATKDVISN
jgi:hypothetical protein